MNSSGTSQRRPARDRRGGQRDEASRDGRERLVRREDDRFSLVGNGDGARFFADRQLKGRGEIVEPDELLIVCDDGRAARAGRPSPACVSAAPARRLARHAATQDDNADDDCGAGEDGRAKIQWGSRITRAPIVSKAQPPVGLVDDPSGGG